MNPSQLLPTTDPISVPWFLFEALGILTFVLHLLFMNAMFGGSIIALFSIGKDKQGWHPIAKSLSTKLPSMVALTVNLGVAPLLFVQVIYGHLLYTSTVLMAAYWLSIVVLGISAYYLLYYYDFKYDALGGKRTLVLGLAVALLVAISFIFSNAMTLMELPEAWKGYFANPSGTLLNLSDPTLLPRYLHFVIAAIAVGGLFVALLGYLNNRKGEDGELFITIGLKWFNTMTLVQFVVGSWFLVSLKREVMLSFMGKNIVNTSVFMVSLLLTLASLHAGFTRRVLQAVGTTVANVALMAIVRAMVRWEYLAPYFHPSSLTLKPEYSPFILFVVSLLLGLLVVAYMVNLYVRAGKED